MEYLEGKLEKEAEKYFYITIEVAKNSNCLKAKCGSTIVKNNEIIGKGFNSPPANLESQRRCLCDKKSYHDKVGDKSCCIHAEQRAIMNALINNPQKIKDSRLYFIRLDLENKIIKSGNPYCTHCSKLALDSGISEFVLWHEKGICVYNTEEYNELSFKFKN